MVDSGKVERLRKWAYFSAPAALVLAIVLGRMTPGYRWQPAGFSRTQAIEKAKELLRASGVDPSASKAAVKSEKDPFGLALAVRQVHEGSQVPALIPPYRVKVRFVSAAGGEALAEVTFDPSGRVVGYELPEGTRGLERAAQVREFTERFPGVVLGAPVETAEGEDAESTFSFSDPQAGQVRHKLRITSQRMTLETDTSGASLLVGQRRAKLQKGIEETAKLFLLVATIYALRLFGRRYRDKELPMARALLLLGIMSVLGAGSFLLNSDRWLDRAAGVPSAIPMPLVLALGAVSLFAAGGALLGGTYAATEGDLREGYPGKLIGLDAILSGYWLSRQSVRSILDGLTIAVYAFLLATAFSAATGQWLGANAAEHIERLYSLQPGMSTLIVLSLAAVWSMVAGLLIPLAFLHRNPRWQSLKWVLLTVVPFTVAAGLNDESMLTAGTILEAALWTAVLVSGFRASGVAAAFAGVTMYGLLIDKTGLEVLQPAATGESILWVVAGIASASLIFWIWRSKDVTDEEVRPHYAGLLAQRIALRAKVEAAREAQTRLRPKQLPQAPGIELNAISHAAGFVGGDFFDFFPLAMDRLAVLVTSGAGPGLPAVLTIALAKGFFRCILPYCESPGAALEDLHKEFAHLLGPEQGEAGLALLFLNPRDQTAAIAKTGAFPLVWRVSGGRAEQVLLTAQSLVCSGTVALRKDEVLLIHTRGLTELLEDQSEAGHRQWLTQTARRAGSATTAALAESLRIRLWGKKRKQPKGELPADFTALAISLDKDSVAAEQPAVKEHAS